MVKRKAIGEGGGMAEGSGQYDLTIHPFRGFCGKDRDYGRTMKCIRIEEKENERNKLVMRKL